MVIPDWNYRPPQAPKIEFQPSENLARPLDRLAAVIVDLFIILLPLYVLISAPFKRWMTASFVLGAEPDFATMIVCMVGLAVLLTLLYQTLFMTLFSATPGKILFDLRVRPMFNDEPLTAWHAFHRALTWIFELAFFGIPFLAVFSNGKRRPLHDRLADTVVVTRSSGLGAPAIWERGLVRGFFAACLSILVLGLSFQGMELLHELKSVHSVVAVKGCDTVDQTLDPDAPLKPHERLNTAMSLYAAGLVDKPCLQSEVDREVRMRVPPAAVTYLAKAFINDDDADVSDSYLDQVCTENKKGPECAMSKIVTAWSEQNWDEVERDLASAPRGSGYLEIWGVRHFMKQAEYQRALKLLNGLANHKEVADFTLIQRVKALWDSNATRESTAAFAEASLALPDDESQNLAAWLCSQQMEHGCSYTGTLACQTAGRPDFKNLDFDQPAVVLSAVMKRECQGGQELNYLSLSESSSNPSWKLFFKANWKAHHHEFQSAAKIYGDILASSDAPDLLKVESLRRSLAFANRRQLKRLTALWNEVESKEAWIKSGNLLLSKVAAVDPLEAAKVASQLMGENALSPQSMALLSRLDLPSKGAARQPASEPQRTKR